MIYTSNVCVLEVPSECCVAVEETACFGGIASIASAFKVRKNGAGNVIL
jgi:hypothetical protein